MITYCLLAYETLLIPTHTKVYPRNDIRIDDNIVPGINFNWS